LDATGLENCALVFRRCKGQLFIGLDKREHSVVVGRRAVTVDVALYASLRRHAALRELLDKVIPKQFVRGC
jgi:hypothetical protein